MPLNKAHFMKHLSPNGNFHGTGFQTIDQASTEIVIERKDERRRDELEPARRFNFGAPDGGFEKMVRDSSIMDTRLRRLDRGGSTVQPGDALSKY